MSTSTRLIENIKLPKFVRVKQDFPHNEMTKDEIRKCIADNFARPEIKATIKPGMSICITAGSRGVANIDTVTRAIVDNVKALGAEPYKDQRRSPFYRSCHGFPRRRDGRGADRDPDQLQHYRGEHGMPDQSNYGDRQDRIC